MRSESGFEDRPQLQLAPEVVEALEREKQSLVAGLREDSLLAKLRSKRDAAREAKPRDIETHEQQDYQDRLDARDAWESDALAPVPAPAAAPLTFDPDTLKSYALQARTTEDDFLAAEERYTVARAARDAARRNLLGYLQEHGVPVR